MNNKVILFGAGNTGKRIWADIQAKKSFFKDKYIAFLDNNPRLLGENIDGLLVNSPNEIKIEEIDVFLICSIYYDQIYEQLRNIGVQDDKILKYFEYIRKTKCEEVYSKRYFGHSKNGSCTFDLKNVVIYTAMFGNYDNIHEPEYTCEGVDYICFTDNRNAKSNVWKFIYMDVGEDGPLLTAKKIKIHPECYVGNYATNIWVDAKLQVKNDLREYIKKYSRGGSMLCFPHFERECIYDEAAECLRLGLASKDRLLAQISKYFIEGYPINNGLYDMACIVRRQKDTFVNTLMDEWEHEIGRFTSRDQISFPYICYKHSFYPDICDLYIYKNRWIRVFPHKEIAAKNY